MQEYENKQAFITEISKMADLFINEFSSIEEADKAKVIEGVDRAPDQMIAYQLGWLTLLMKWDEDEAAGKEVVTPAEGYKWNNMGGLYQSFYDAYTGYSLLELQEMFKTKVNELTTWLDTMSEEDVFTAGSRKWAASTPSNWPVWKWVHINTVAPFKSFRSKIRKWKKLNTSN